MGTKKYIFVTGGVLSGVGKGITAASIGAVLQAKGIVVSIQKCDPYLNVDAGLLNPEEHGECFVTKDGAETDLDLGHYERFLDLELTRQNSVLSGRLFLDLINQERQGGFSGKTVQMVPHFTAAIQDKIRNASQDSEIHIVEIGGTVGDYESLSFIEAIREFALKVGRQDCLFVHVVYAPFIETSKEFKTKPAQNALRDLRSFGIMPDAVIVRTEKPAPSAIKHKIALFSGVPEDQVQLMPNVDTVFRIPQILAQNGLHRLLSDFTDNQQKPNLTRWQKIIEQQNSAVSKTVTVGLITEYQDNEDIYLSVTEALRAAAWQLKLGLKIKWLQAESVNQANLNQVDALLAPSSFAAHGWQGCLATAKFALETQKPYLGIGVGLQAAVVAAARLAGLTQADSQEFNSAAAQKIVYLPDQANDQLRLGSFEAKLAPESFARQLYEQATICERHRHRYEVNPEFVPDLMRAGLRVAATSTDEKLIEMIEAVDHPYFIATQSHPEFSSRPFRPHPLFVGLLEAASSAK